jgi:dTDP-glucose 4,6-dehydratase
MRLLVTGGLGFIGSHFVRHALTRSDVTSVAVLDSMTYAADLSRLDGLDGDFELIVGSIADPELVDRAVSRVDVVVNFAAESHNDNSLKGPRVFYDTNVTGLLVLADACVRNEVRLHHVSTDEVFGDMPFESSEKFTRLSRLNPSSPYSASKAAGDLALHAWARSFGLAYTISNCSNNFGSGQHAEKLIPTIFRHLSQGKPAPIYGSGKNIRDWIHVSDHVTGIFAAITTGKLGETYLLGASDEVANIDLALKIGDFFGLGPSDSVSFVTDRPGHDRRYAIDWEHSRSELGWKPTHPKLLESIPELAQHYSAN